ncbi:MAG TPA: helix-turn-helix domain-containing protein [Edaphocola sp.]|nr:helix-turn-helix domain-containing protein [Edaphocola sp.]
MTTTTQVEGTTAADLLAAIREIVSEAVRTHTPAPETKETFLTRQEVSEMFQISLPTVHAWINAGILNPYKLGTQTRFKKSEILKSPKAYKLINN